MGLHLFVFLVIWELPVWHGACHAVRVCLQPLPGSNYVAIKQRTEHHDRSRTTSFIRVRLWR